MGIDKEVERVEARIREQVPFIERVLDMMGTVIVGQRKMIERMLIGLFCDGHILLEGVPGLAKTLALSSLARIIDAQFRRIQFTPDLMPADVVGTLVYNGEKGEFSLRRGPIFANIILADEVNRAPAKVQSALLEAMQERQVTIGDDTYKLDDPFLVLATQNPIEHAGTYPLPEAQLDRFMFKLLVTYPSKKEEREILDRMTGERIPSVEKVITPQDIVESRDIVRQITIEDIVKDYIIDIVFATRKPEDYGLTELVDFVEYGASPRATIWLTLAAKAHAFLRGRGFVSPEDVKAIAPDVLRHRVIPTYLLEAEERTSDYIVEKVLENVEMP